jgi:undecaprenyl-diphosphatase
MLELLKAGFLGLVEGITEFLPISSTGHLIVSSQLIGAADSGGTFELVIQLGAVLAVAWFYRRDLVTRIRAIRSSGRFWLMLLLAVLPAGIVGLWLGDWIKSVLFSPVTVGVALILGGLVLWLVERTPHRETSPEVDIDRSGIIDLDATGPGGLDSIQPGQAIRIGLIQLASFVPGVSRSGATIVGGLLTGLDRETATVFSFYLALPTLGAATVFDLVRNLDEITTGGQTGRYAVGIIVAFLTALASIGWLLRYVSSHDFRPFAKYRILAGTVVLGLVAAGVL